MNKYEILEIIGEGTYGVVVKALNKETNQVVAIKKFKEIAKNFIKRELKMLNNLRSCEFIVNLKEAYRRKEKVYFIFEYVEKTLLQLLQENRNGLDQNLTKNIVFQLCKAIEKCHSLDIIHRDIKPENLLIDKNNNLKLCDFGFARETAIHDIDEPLTEYVATRWYRSPELILFCPYGKPVDIWAIGCIACECSNSRALFPGKSDIDQIYLIMQLIGPLPDYQYQELHKNSKFTSLRSLKIERKNTLDTKFGTIMDEKMLDFVKRCLIIDPENRVSVEECLKHSIFEDKQQVIIDNKPEMKKSSINSFKTNEIKVDGRESKTLFYKTLNPVIKTNDNELLIYNLLNNNFDIHKSIVPKPVAPEGQMKKQIAFPVLNTENKDPQNNPRETEKDKPLKQNNRYINFIIRNHLNQQQKDSDKLFFKSNVKFNDYITEIPKKTSNDGHFNNENREDNFTSKLNILPKNQTKVFRSESKQESTRGGYMFKFENKKDPKNAKRSLSTLETYKNELGVKIVRNTSITPTKNFETFSTNPNVLKNQLNIDPNEKRKVDLKLRQTPDLEPKSSLKRYKNSFQYSRQFPLINLRTQKFQQINSTNGPVDKINGENQIFESLKILNFRKT